MNTDRTDRYASVLLQRTQRHKMRLWRIETKLFTSEKATLMWEPSAGSGYNAILRRALPTFGLHCCVSQQRFHLCFETFHSRLLSRWAASELCGCNDGQILMVKHLAKRGSALEQLSHLFTRTQWTNKCQKLTALGLKRQRLPPYWVVLWSVDTTLV